MKNAKNAKKPKPQTVSRLDYHECVEYIEKKLGYNIRDTLGLFEEKPYNSEIEYRDWWHYLIKYKEVHNGCEIEIGSDLLKGNGAWEDEITQAFIDEFGDDATYYVWW